MALRAHLRRRPAVAVELLECRLTPANLPPLAPVILEPASEGVVLSPFDVHMVIGTFTDPNPSDTHRATDWQLWTTGATSEEVWAADNVTDGVSKFHIHLADGVFVNSLAGRHELLFNTDYRLRVRVRDSSNEAATEWSDWTNRQFHTQAELQPTPGVGTWAVTQPGYKVEVVATGFQLPVNIAFVPSPGPHPDDPLFYVTELYGQIKVVNNDGHVGTYAAGLLNFNPNGQFPGSGEQGVAGITVDPATGDLFVTMLYDGGSAHFPKIVRFHSTDGGHTAASQTTILDMPNEPMGQSHQISNVTIGPDGKLYVHVGDGFDSGSPQNLDSFRGKILRLNLDGSAPTDNPFYDAANGINARDYVFAFGLRNPFGGAWRDADGMHYEAENGPTVDRFAQIVGGRNYLYDGSDESMANFALYNWNPSHAPVNLAFVQGSSFNGSGFPASKQGHAFVAESGPTFASGPQALGKRISEFVLDAAGSLVQGPIDLITYNGTGKGTVVGLAAGPDGLYFSDLYADNDPNPVAFGANVLRVRYIGTAPPATPGSLTAQAISSSQINLSWADLSDNEEGFRIEQSVDGAPFTLIATAGANATTFAVANLQSAVSHTFRVRAFNNDLGNGGYSNIASATTAGTPGIPPAPSGLAAAAGSGQVTLTWTAAPGATSYNLYRGMVSGGEGDVPRATGIIGTGYVDTALTNGVAYFYKVTAINGAGVSLLSSEASATPVAAPTAPVGLNAIAGSAQVTLSWTAIAGATSYRVYRGTTSGGQGNIPIATGLATANFTDVGLTNGTTYFYKVSAVGLGGEGARSAEVSATPTAPAVAARINFQPAGVPVPAGYLVDSGLVYADRGNGLSYGWNNLNAVNTRDRDNPLAADQRYDTLIHMVGNYWEIAVPNGSYVVHLVAGDPDYTDSVYRINVEGMLAVDGTPTGAAHWVEGTVTVTVGDGRLTIASATGSSNNKIDYVDITSAGPAVPVAPASLTAIAGNGQVTLNWAASSSAQSYNVYRGTTSGGQGTAAIVTGLSTTAFVDTGRTNGVTYYYKVSAVNAVGEGPKSAEATATPVAPAVPATPAGLTATSGNGQVALAWTAVSGAVSYSIYRGSTSGGQAATPLVSGLASPSYVDSAVTNGLASYYQVSAVNAIGESSRSSEASAIPAVPTFAVHVNFQPSGAPIPAGYLIDAGATYASRGNGYTYGWSRANTDNPRDRNDPASADQLHDTLIHFGGNTWEIAVPNGSYRVHLVAGDPSYTDSVHKINVENVLAINGIPTPAARWLEATVTVAVADGKLTVVAASGAVNAKINYIDVTIAPGVPLAAVPPLDSLPLSLNQLWVSQRYWDLLGRPVDIGGLAYWSSLLAQGLPRLQVIQAMTQSTEYHTHQVQDVYDRLLNRAADPAGLHFFTDLLTQGGVKEQIQLAILGSAEYFQRRGTNSDAGFLTALYLDLLQRPIDAAGLSYFAQQLASGASIRDVAAQLMHSTEYFQQRVQSIYQVFLNRTADDVGLDYFVQSMRQGNPEKAVLDQIFTSAEFLE